MTTDADIELIEQLAAFSTDPYGFALWAFPWGEPGELANFRGPNPWQSRILKQVRDGVLSAEQAILIAVASGHGVGKSALVGILTWWAFSTREKTRGVITANTENQLKTKTWVEIAKWHRLFIGKHLFKLTATSVFSVDEELAREWRIDIVPWSERNTEAFAGLHNQGNRIFIVYDEASAIPDVIWEVTEGALTDRNTEILWFAFGNPTKNKGRFRDCFPGGKFSHRWKSVNVDSREVEFTDHEQIARWIADYGEDSDFVRIRVRGMFPRYDESSFISRELAEACINRTIENQSSFPIILGVDVARYGKDLSCIVARQGRNCAVRPPLFFQGISITQLAHRVGRQAQETDADAIMIDAGGVGGGLVDILLDLGFPVYPIDFGSRPDGLHDGVRYANKRAEIWGLMREALPGLSCLNTTAGAEVDLVAELSGPTYVLNAAGGILLESKEAMLRRGVPSPNYADALALTFALPIAPRLVFPLAPSKPYNPYEGFYEH